MTLHIKLQSRIFRDTYIKYLNAIDVWYKIYGSEEYTYPVQELLYTGQENCAHSKQKLAIESAQQLLLLWKKDPKNLTIHNAKAYWHLLDEYFQKICFFNTQIEIMQQFEQQYKIVKKTYSDLEFDSSYHSFDILHSMGKMYFAKSDYLNATICFQEAINISGSATLDNKIDEHKIALLYHNMGDAYSAQSSYTEALSCYREALSCYREALSCYNEKEVNLTFIVLHYKMGIAYFHKQEYQESLKSHRISLSLNEKYADHFDSDTKHKYAVINNSNIGAICTQLKKYNGAIFSYTESIKCSLLLPKSQNKCEMLITLYSNLGDIFYIQNDMQNAILCQEYILSLRSKEVHKNQPTHPDIIHSYYILAYYSYKSGDLESAHDYSERAIHILNESNMQYQRSIATYWLSNTGQMESQERFISKISNDNEQHTTESLGDAESSYDSSEL